MIDRFYLLIALIVALLAGGTAMVAGVMAEARWTVILFRSLASFFITGLVLCIVIFIFEKFNFQNKLKEETSKEEPSVQVKEALADVQEVEVEDNSFKPLATDSLRRVVGEE